MIKIGGFMKYFTLNDGIKIPAIGLGTYKIKDQETMERVIEAAFENGYEYIDTAKFYENERYLGNALKNAPLKREEYKIATKVWPIDFGEDETKKSIDNSLNELQVDYIDVIHLHWYGRYFKEAWKVFQDYKRQGLVKSLAVCNFEIEQMKELLELGETPVMDQLESSPYFHNKDVVRFLEENKIQHQAWSPLTQGKSGLLEEEVLINISNKYGKTPAQIALKWNVERGTMVIPKTATPSRVKENISIFDFELDQEDMNAIASIDKKKRFSNHPTDPEWLESISRK